MDGVLRRTGLLVCACLIVGTAPAAAQVATGEIFGKVLDGTGAVLPGVTVTLASAALIQPQSVVTAESGGYRFPRIPVGTYSVTFDLSGFKRTVHEGIVIQAGFNAEVDARLELTTVQETVTVSGVSPVVDTKSTTLAASFNKEALEKIPSARDPWVILEQTPGMIMSGSNVGGNLSGQQTSFSAFGSSSNQQWNIDGAVISDIASGNSSPTYYDFDSFEEIQITTGGSDASQQGAGVQINFVTKSGGNTLRGSGRFYRTNQKFEAQNITDTLRSQGAGAGNPIQDIQDYGFEVGGPIVKNRAWFWGAASRNKIDVGTLGFYKPTAGCAPIAASASSFPLDQVTNCLNTDQTVLTNYNGKVQFQEATGHKSTFTVTDGIKTRNARGADAFHPLVTTAVQKGPTIFYRGDHQWIASSRMTLTAQYTHITEDWGLYFQNPGLVDVQALNFVDVGGSTGTWDRSKSSADYHTIRPQDDIRTDANYFLSSFLGGDNAMKFGFAYRRSPVESISTFGGGAVARIRSTNNMNTCTVGGVTYPSGCEEANVIRDGDYAYTLYSQSAYWNDSYKRSRVTVNVGVRYDRQYDIATQASIQANRILGDKLPGVNYSGQDSGVRYSDFSPRLGFTLDVRGNGKTVLKANAARYYGLGMSTASRLEPTTPTTLRYPWRDLNGDLIVQANELDLSRFLTTPSSNYDPANPSSVTTPTIIDPRLRNDITDEAIVAVDHELMTNFGVGVSYIYRKYHQFQNLYRTQDFEAAYQPVNFTASCGNGSCSESKFTGTYYQRPTALHAQTILRNDTIYNTYNGLEVTARKRLSNRWMMSGSVVRNRELHYELDPNTDYIDPTNHLPVDLISGYESGTRNGPWVGKLSGLYQFPWNITAAAFFNAHSNFPFNPSILSPNRTGGQSGVSILLQPTNSIRLPAVYQLDLHVDKALAFGRQRRISLNFDVFNIANNNVVLARVERQNTSTANNITTVLAPRVARLGLKVNF